MAKITEQYLVVKLSKLTKNTSDDANIIDEDIISAIGQLIETTLSDIDSSIVVEVETTPSE